MNSTPTPRDTEYSASYKYFVLVMLTLVYAFNFIDRQLLVILQEPIKAEMGLSDKQLGLLSGFSFALVYVTAGIPIAYWADRGNRRNIVAIALTVWSGMTAVSAFVQSYVHLLLARIGVGLGEAGGSPPSHSMISDYFPPQQRGTALSFYSSGVYIGILLGFMFGGLIAQTWGWRMAFLIVGLPGVVLAIALWATVKEPLRGRWEQVSQTARKPTLEETLGALKQRPSFWFIALGCACTSYVSYGNGNFLPSFLIRNHDMNLAQVGVVLALVSGISGAIGTFLGGYLSDRFGHSDPRWYLWVPLIGGALAYLPYFYVLLTDNTQMSLVTLFAVNLLSTLYLGPAIATCHTLVSPAMRALTSAVLFFILNIIGLGLGPFMVGLVSDLLSASYGDQSLRYSMVINANMALVSLLMFYLAAKHLPTDLQKPQPALET